MESNPRFLRGIVSDALLLGGATVLVALFSAYLFIQQETLKAQLDALRSEHEATKEGMAKLSKEVHDVSERATGLSNVVTSTQQNIDAVRSQVGGIEQTVGTVTGTVGTLQKLALTDQELLAKYSKVYFLSENYAPKHLADVPSEYVYPKTEKYTYLAEAWPFLKTMLDAAHAAGTPIEIKSAYRSFKEQQTLKNAYTVTYGAGTANSFSADQGYSEHQLGTAVDLVISGEGKTFGFEKTPAYAWLLQNAHRYGFVLSYPEGNSSYIFEPWHWRFVGVQLATDLYNKHQHFYDLTQRELDQYLIAIFDQR